MSDATATRRVRRWPDPGPRQDHVVVEEPLEIRVEDRSIAVTMRTPGADLDLAAGFLLTEGIIDGPDDLLALQHLPGDDDRNTVVALVAGGVQAHLAAIEQATRELYASSACGICGKASIDRVHILCDTPIVPMTMDPLVVGQLPQRLRAAQPTFEQTGGLHAAALVFADGTVEVIREDIGRHNAVDKVLGWRLHQDRVPVSDRALVVSGRAGFEIVQKARVAGVPLIVAFGAASTLAIDLAEQVGMGLIGFAKADRHTVYC